MSSRALHHVALGAVDVEKVARFYRELFGLSELTRHHDPAGELRSIWLDAAGVILMIERSTRGPERVAGVGAGPFLLAFRIEPGEREVLEHELEQRGVPIESRTDCTSYTRDPEGNRVALCHYPLAEKRA